MKNLIKLVIVCAVTVLALACQKAEVPKPAIPIESQKDLVAQKAQSPAQSEIVAGPHTSQSAAPHESPDAKPDDNDHGKPIDNQETAHEAHGKDKANGHAQPHPKLEVDVPDSVKGKWESVKLGITDKTKSGTQTVTVKLGQVYKVPGSGLAVEVGDFLPDFKMNGIAITSVSNETNNPAVQVGITENGKEIFKGWLYSKYPSIHPFQHDRFSIVLLEGIKK
ncbi:MAG: DUF2155 domain-containing protein [Nitrospirae bacterium]|nr:DUF2155 domain-containing protein [Nitrospirota bacterium]